MAKVTREQVELRAFWIWQEAGCPEGSSLAHWLEAELELGLIPELQGELVAAAIKEQGKSGAPADEGLQTSVDSAVPRAQRLPRGADENPMSEHVKDVAGGQTPRPGNTTFEGGDSVQR
jgi:hypothetical protein